MEWSFLIIPRGTGLVEYMKIGSRIGILYNSALVGGFLELVLYIANSCASSELSPGYKQSLNQTRTVSGL